MMSHTKLCRVFSGATAQAELNDRIPLMSLQLFRQCVRSTSSVCEKYKGGRGGGKGGGGGGKSLTMDNLNRNIIALQYAVQGPIVIRAVQIQKELEKGAKKPFKRVIRANIGDCHAMGQLPITFFRQVMACAAYPTIMEQIDFPADVKEKACKILKACGGMSIGSYTMSIGIEEVRKSVATYIERRDGGIKCDYNNVSLSNGGASSIKSMLQLFAESGTKKQSAVMIPIPQYPLYSAALAEFGLGEVGYYLDEDHDWALEEKELERSYAEGSKDHLLRALVVINPGNPTGQVLTRKNIETVIKFACKHSLFILADEVYQDNVYGNNKFYSFKKVSQEMGAPYDKVELASFMSASKGYMGECGLRGGWMEVINMDPAVQANLTKALSALLCPTSMGQLVIECVAEPPKQGEPSYELYMKEKTSILSMLAERAKMIVETFNKMEGFTCNVVQGSMYAFPNIQLTQKAIAAAKADNKLPDVFYAFRLLEETGICIIPGSGFGQKPGSYHFRTTLLPPIPELKLMCDVFQKFHANFTKKYS